MSFAPGGASRFERPTDTSCGAVDPVTMEMMHRYGIRTENYTIENHSKSQAHNILARFLVKHHSEAPDMQVKPLVDEQRTSHHQEHVYKTPRSIPIELNNTASLSSSRSEDANTDLWKVKHNGEFLGSTSFGSSSNELHSNPTHMLKLLHLKTATEENDSSTSTEKITNHGSRYDESPNRSYSYIRSFSNTPSFQAKLRNRLSQVATENSVNHLSVLRPKSSSETVRQTASFRTEDVCSRESPMRRPTNSEDLSLTQIGVVAGSDSEGRRSRGDDLHQAGRPSRHFNTSLSASVEAKTVASSNEDAFSPGEGGDLTQAGESDEETMNKPTLSEGHGILVKTLSGSYDESEFKQMTSITNTYQKYDSTTSNVKPGSKVSAIPMSGIGVDLRNSYVCDSQPVLTPREASSTSCSIASLVDHFFGKGSLKKESAFAFVVSFFVYLITRSHKSDDVCWYS